MQYKLRRPGIATKKIKSSALVNYSLHLHQEETEKWIKRSFCGRSVSWLFLYAFEGQSRRWQPRGSSVGEQPNHSNQKNHPSHLPPQDTVMTAGLRQSAISLLVKSFPWNSSKPHFYLTTLLVFSRLLSFLLIAGAMPRLVSLHEIKRNPVIFSTRLPVVHIHFSPLTSSSLLHSLLNGQAEEGHR